MCQGSMVSKGVTDTRNAQGVGSKCTQGKQGLRLTDERTEKCCASRERKCYWYWVSGKEKKKHIKEQK